VIAASSRELAALPRQAKRLRFEDEALERSFREERVAASMMRARVTLIAGMFAACGVGVGEAFANPPLPPEFNFVNLRLRFFGIAGAWLVMLISTFLPGHRSRADWVNVAGTITACWALGLIYWHFALLHPAANMVNAAEGGFFTVLLVTAVALPLSFRALTVTLVGSLAGPVVFYGLTLPVRNVNPHQLAIGCTLIGGVVLVLNWWRESAERQMFAQREHLSRLNAELARLNAEKNEFMAIAAHDLRSPLASVHGLAGQLESGQVADRAGAHGAIRELAQRMLELVENYLGVHAAESGGLPVHLVAIDLREIAQTAAARAGPRAAAKRQRVEVLPGPAVWAHADATLLAQVADNFVSNALKFSPPAARVELAVLVAENGSRVRLAVTDEGPGVAVEEQKNLFRKFSRATARPTGGETSHGLGLAVTKRLAEAMGATVGCDSELGAGATFWIELPAERG